MTGITRGAALFSYSAKPGAISFCLFQIGSRSSGFATRALTLTVSAPLADVDGTPMHGTFQVVLQAGSANPG